MELREAAVHSQRGCFTVVQHVVLRCATVAQFGTARKPCLHILQFNIPGCCHCLENTCNGGASDSTVAVYCSATECGQRTVPQFGTL